MRFTEWLFLYYLAKNMDAHLFRKVLRQITDELRHPNEDDQDDQGIDMVDGGHDVDDSDIAMVKLRYEDDHKKA